ncbi:MAG TPA: hypothetical protein VLJ59_08035 [Mycobacteriales bacterium]|nr:hypothetical protein [Mycobacteriales bacterium]
MPDVDCPRCKGTGAEPGSFAAAGPAPAAVLVLLVVSAAVLGGGRLGRRQAKEHLSQAGPVMCLHGVPATAGRVCVTCRDRDPATRLVAITTRVPGVGRPA